MSGDVTLAMTFGFNMMLVAMSIAVGLFASSVVSYRTKMKMSNAVLF